MADRIEREIEEILAKLDEQDAPNRGGGRPPIPLLQHRAKARAKQTQPPRAPRQPLLPAITPASLLILGAALVVGGLLFSGVFHPLVWVSFAGVVIFLAAFVWSFTRRPSGPRSPSGGVYWRDRYISLDPQRPSPWDRVKRRFRR